jgi:hypothetical protein
MVAWGSDNGRAKLTAEQVLDIYVLVRSKRYLQRELAEEFGITQSAVSLLMHRRRWQWLLLDNNEGNEMSNEEFEARLAASEKRVAELEAKLRGEPPEPFKREPRQPLDLTARATMPPQAMRDLVAAVPDRLMSDLRADARKPNPVTQSVAQLTKGGGERVQIQPGSGWVNPNPLTPPPGLNYVDQQVDAQDAIDKAERRRLFKE